MIQMGTIPHDVTMETIRNIGKHLIPQRLAACLAGMNAATKPITSALTKANHT